MFINRFFFNYKKLVRKNR